MANIRAALDKLIVIQAAVNVTDPSVVAVLKAYKYVAPQNAILPDAPCFMNDWTLRDTLQAPSLRIIQYRIRSILYVLDADIERALDIATALFEDYMDRLGADVNLGGAIDGGHSLRGPDPTLGAAEFAGKSYAAIETFLDFEIKRAFTWATT